MGAIVASLIAFVVIVAGAVIGILLRRALPEHHLSEDTRDIVRLATGLIGTVAALVLGLMVASAKNSYDTQASQVTNLTANLILSIRSWSGTGTSRVKRAISCARRSIR